MRLRELGIEITVGHFGNPWLARRCEEEQIPQLLIGAHQHFKSTLTLPLFAQSFAKEIKRHQFDAVHAHLFGATVAAALAGRLAGTRVVGTLHDSYTITERRARIYLLRIAALTGTKLVSVAEYMQTLFCSMAKFPPNSWQTIHNGVDTAHYKPLTDKIDREACRAQLGLPTSGVLIGSVGRLVALKRFAELIQAFCRSPSEAKLIIIGEGPERAVLEKLVLDLDAGNRVYLLGQRDDISTLLPLLDIFTLWSETEGLSCSITEAMACGLPCVVSDVGGNHELITSGQNGYLLPAEGQEILNKTLTELTASHSMRKLMGEAALQQTITHFSIDTMAHKYETLLRTGHTDA